MLSKADKHIIYYTYLLSSANPANAISAMANLANATFAMANLADNDNVTDTENENENVNDTENDNENVNDTENDTVTDTDINKVSLYPIFQLMLRKPDKHLIYFLKVAATDPFASHKQIQGQTKKPCSNVSFVTSGKITCFCDFPDEFLYGTEKIK